MMKSRCRESTIIQSKHLDFAALHLDVAARHMKMHVVCARTRLKFVGGIRARYDEEQM